MSVRSRRQFLQGSLGLAGLGLAAGCGLPPLPSPPPKVARVGLLHVATPPEAFTQAFSDGLRELGYMEGRDVLLERRSAEGDYRLLPDLVAELLRLPVDVLVTDGPAIRVAKAATSTTPIVMTLISDPVGQGLVQSLARPGGNATGLALLPLGGKRLELLREAAPRISRAGVFWNPTNPSSTTPLDETQTAAQSLGLAVESLSVSDAADLEAMFDLAVRARVDTIVVATDPLLAEQRNRIVTFAARQRLPAMYPSGRYIEAGGLMSYSPSFPEAYRRAATYVDKILKGAKPAELPVEQPTKFDFIINLKTAQAIGLTIPQSILMQATEIIQ